MRLHRPSAALLSRHALRHNLDIIRSQIKSNAKLHTASAEIMAVVKADAYGHDVSKIIPEFKKQGIKRFSVASLDEAVEARQLDKNIQILVLGGTFDWPKATIDLCRKQRLEIAVTSIDVLKAFLKRPEVPIHLKLDTGMNRLGIKPEDWSAAFDLLKKHHRKLAGLMTHFASATKPSYARQAMLFEEAVRWFWSEGFRPTWIHCENSAALFTKSSIKKGLLAEHGNLVRPGISLYGYLNQELKRKSPLQPILELISEVGLVKKVEVGEGISYEHLYRAKRKHDYAVLPIGYADGVAKEYRDHLVPQWRSKNGQKKGKLQILGAICMDMIMVRAPANKKWQAKDQVAFWGRFPNPLLQNKIVSPYELNIRVSKRVPRIWVS